MTINIAVVTAEALVFGCDSIASTTKHLLDPFDFNPKSVANNKISVEFSYEDLEQYVTGAWGGVTKMFPIQTEGACVAATTAGFARLNDRTMSSFAAEFMEKQQKLTRPRVNVKAIANDFLTFIRKEYDLFYHGTNVPANFREGPVFLVGGYGRKDQLPSLYRIDVQNNDVSCVYKAGEYGLSWAGQADAVVRLIRGYDYPLRVSIEEEIKKEIDAIYDGTSDALKKILQDVLDKLKVELPKGVNTKLPPKKNIKLSWDSVKLSMDYSSWPIHDVIDFASFLVNMQSARAKFVPGVATVGGRIHIGVVTKGGGFNMLDEPKLRHRNVGFTND